MSDIPEPVKRKPGRPKGARNKRSPAAEAIARSRAILLRENNIPAWIAVMTPRDVMMHAMVRAAAADNWPLAADIAAKVAPYLHPRLSQVEMNVRDGVANLSQAEIERQIHDLEERAKISDVAEDGTVGGEVVVDVTAVEVPEPRTNPDGPIIDPDGNSLN